MGAATDRRDFLRILLSGAPAFVSSFGAARPAVSFGGTTTTGPITAGPLSDNLIHFTGAPGDNIVVVTGIDGLVMVNGGREEMSADLLRAVAEPTRGKRILDLLKTQLHPRQNCAQETVR